MNSTYERYKKIFKKMIAKSDTTKVRPKFKDIKLCYKRANDRLKIIRRYDVKRGIDMGCADSSMLILGKMMGINIEGVDYEKCPYRYMQQYLATKGFKVHPVALDDAEYKFLEGEFDFIVTCGVIAAIARNIKGDQTAGLEKRILNLLAKIRPGGYWFINSSVHLKMIMRSELVKKTFKDKKIIIKHV